MKTMIRRRNSHREVLKASPDFLWTTITNAFKYKLYLGWNGIGWSKQLTFPIKIGTYAYLKYNKKINNKELKEVLEENEEEENDDDNEEYE